MNLAAGTRLGPYEVVAPIGAGGMGEVYKARDTRLDRTVAIKVLPAALAADAQFRERFDREARAISQLTHPHICTLHDVGDAMGTSFLVMEMLEGETLAARLEKGALPLEQALRTAIEIASALDTAHRAGIVHRDLKPGNIMLTRSGAKLLDFGLAKTNAPAVSTSGLSTAPTTPPATMTADGTILGTFQYMAPEQIEGLDADARSDIFAFGCVLYEMLTSKKAFEGKTRASLLGAILKDEPPPVSQQLSLAPSSSKGEPGAHGSTGSPRADMLDRIVKTCLAKEPDDRWQSARDLMRELQWIADGKGSSASTAVASMPTPSARTMPILAAASAAAAVAAVITWLMLRPAPVARPVVRLQTALPAATTLGLDPFASNVAISPDGRHVAFVGAGTLPLFVRALDRDEATQLPGLVNVRGPFFSPDGEWIGFFVGPDLKKVSIRGGPPVTICANCAAGNRGASWGADDTIVFSATGGTSGLRRVPAGGGEPTRLTTVDQSKGDRGHVWPDVLPNGKGVLFTILSGGSVDNGQLAVLDFATGASTIIGRGGSQPRYVTTGHVVYGVSGSLRAISFDIDRLAAVGNPVPVQDHVVTKPSGAADFGVSRDGTLAYISGDVQGALTLAWVDRQGREEPVGAPPRAFVYLRLSPDGRYVALDSRDEENDIWIWDFGRKVLTRFTKDAGFDEYPVWSPDGKRIAFASSRSGTLNLFWQATDGTGAAERITTSEGAQFPWFFTLDGKSLVIRDNDPKTFMDISLVPVEGERTSKPLIRTPFSEQNAELSPDGRWIA